MTPPDLFSLVFAGLLSWVFLADARTYRIPNAAVAALALCGLAMLGLNAPQLIAPNLLLAAAALAVGYGLYRCIGMGAGDAKLLAAIAIWLGAEGLMAFLFWFGAGCAILSGGLAIGRRIACNVGGAPPAWRPLQKDAPVPLALAIAPAALFAHWLGPIGVFG